MAHHAVSRVSPVKLYGMDVEPVMSKKFTEEQINTCLLLMVKVGSPKRISAIVKETHGWDIPAHNMAHWRRQQYPARFAAIFKEHQAEAEDQMIQNASQAVIALAGTAEKAREKLDEKLENDQIEAKDLGGVVRNVTLAQAVQTDKLLVLTGKPTNITVNVSAEDVLRNLASKHYVTVEADEVVEIEQETS